MILSKHGFLLVCLFVLVSKALLAQDSSERDKKIDQALYFYYNGKAADARAIAVEFKNRYPHDPFYNELNAEIIWLELNQRAVPKRHFSEDVNYDAVRKNIFLVEQFKDEIFTGLVLTQEKLNKDPNDVKAIFLRGLLKVRYGGFVAKFESGLKSYAEADRETADGLNLIKRAIELDPTLCSANYLLGLSEYLLLRASENILNSFFIKWRSAVYRLIGRRLNINAVFTILRKSMQCRSDYYFSKDVEVDKMFVFQDILVKQAGLMDKEILPVLEELNRRFPENQEIKNNLFLVNRHLEDRKRHRR